MSRLFPSGGKKHSHFNYRILANYNVQHGRVSFPLSNPTFGDFSYLSRPHTTSLSRAPCILYEGIDCKQVTFAFLYCSVYVKRIYLGFASYYVFSVSLSLFQYFFSYYFVFVSVSRFITRYFNIQRVHFSVHILVRTFAAFKRIDE